jgi:hypothetical protein
VNFTSMRLRTPKIILATVLAAATAAGCAAASSQAATLDQAGTVPAAATHLAAWSVNSDGPRFQAILTGVVGDYGPAIAIRPDGAAGAKQTSELRLKLSRGSFGLSIAKIDSELAQALRNWRYDQATCSVHVTASGPAPVVAGSGTGAYRGIAGAFALTVTADEVDARRPGCNGHLVNGRPDYLAQLIVIAGTGAVSVGRRS